MRSHRMGRQQLGMTTWGLLYVLVTLGLIGIAVVKSVPVYLNAYEVRTALDWAASQPELRGASAMDIQQRIQRRFSSGYVSNLSGRDIAVQRVDGGRLLSVDYEVRRPLFFNIALTYSFSEQARLPNP